MPRSGSLLALLLALLLLLLLLLLLPSAAAVAEPELEAAVAALRARGYNLFGNSILASDLRFEIIRANSSVTLFAPTDAALFALDMALPAAAYLRALRYHVALGSLNLASPPDGAALPTLLPGRQLPVSRRSPEALFVTVAGVDVVLPGLFYGRDLTVHGLRGILSLRRRESPAPPGPTTASTSPPGIHHPRPTSHHSPPESPDLHRPPAISAKSHHPPPRWPYLRRARATSPKSHHPPPESSELRHPPAISPEFHHSLPGLPDLRHPPGISPEFLHSPAESPHTNLPPERSGGPPDPWAPGWSPVTDPPLMAPAWSLAGPPNPWAPAWSPTFELSPTAPETPAPAPPLISPAAVAGGPASPAPVAEHVGGAAQMAAEVVFPMSYPPSPMAAPAEGPAAGFSSGGGGGGAACLNVEPMECALMEAFGHVIAQLDSPRGQPRGDAL